MVGRPQRGDSAARRRCRGRGWRRCVIPVDHDRSDVTEAQVVAPDIQVDERVPGKRSGSGRTRQHGESRHQPRRRTEAQGEERLRVRCDGPPVGLLVPVQAGQVAWRGGLMDGDQGVKDGCHTRVSPWRRPVRAGQILQREHGPLSVIVEADHIRKVHAAHRAVVAVLDACPAGGQLVRADLHERRAPACGRTLMVRHDPACGGLGVAAVGGRRMERGRTPTQGALDPVEVVEPRRNTQSSAKWCLQGAIFTHARWSAQDRNLESAASTDQGMAGSGGENSSSTDGSLPSISSAGQAARAV